MYAENFLTYFHEKSFYFFTKHDIITSIVLEKQQTLCYKVQKGVTHEYIFYHRP